MFATQANLFTEKKLVSNDDEVSSKYVKSMDDQNESSKEEKVSHLKPSLNQVLPMNEIINHENEPGQLKFSKSNS